MAADALLTGLLREVSRSFYRTLQVLPAAIRPQISLAYLLARTTDTIADTGLVALDRRLSALQSVLERILGGAKLVDLGDLASHQAAPAERILLEKCEESIGLLNTLSPDDLQLARDVLATIAGGQELDLRRFAGASPDRIIALNSAAELEDYTYRVAGCVGEFWTRMCRAHLFPRARLDDSWLLANAVRFGKGLQLVNILRDIPADLRQGRCYLPSEELLPVGLKPADLLDPANEPRFRRVYDPWLDRAEAHLRAGWDYTNALPRAQMRVRLACAWPILIGLETLQLLRAGAVLDSGRRIKVSRSRVKRIMVRSVLTYPFPPAWRALTKAGQAPAPG